MKSQSCIQFHRGGLKASREILSLLLMIASLSSATENGSCFDEIRPLLGVRIAGPSDDFLCPESVLKCLKADELALDCLTKPVF